MTVQQDSAPDGEGLGSKPSALPTEQAGKPVVAGHTPDEFWCNPREGEFSVALRIEATLYETVKAATKEDARAKIEAMLDANEMGVYGSDFDDVRIDHIGAEMPMYLVHRPGTTVNGTSRIQPGDEPREPKDDYERRTYTRPPALAKALPQQAAVLGSSLREEER